MPQVSKRTARRSDRREIANLKASLKACTEQVGRLERRVARLTEMIADLRDKIRV